MKNHSDKHYYKLIKYFEALAVPKMDHNFDDQLRSLFSIQNQLLKRIIKLQEETSIQVTEYEILSAIAYSELDSSKTCVSL